MTKGKFIAIEGPDGSGKSTVAKRLYRHLKQRGVKCMLTREPGGTEISEKIREIILDNNNKEMDSMTEALLYAAARAQHVEEKIKPLLEQGYTVITDRYVLSSLAYQGHARGLGIDEVMKINEYAMGGLYPDKVLFFDVSPEVALSRKFINREGDRMENEGSGFHNTTYEGYQLAIDNYSKNVAKIDADGTIQENLERCIEALSELNIK